MTRPHDTAKKGHHTIDPRAGACGSTRVRLGWWGSHDTKIVSWLGGDRWCRNTAQLGAAIRRSSAPRYGAAVRHDTTLGAATRRAVRARQGIVLRYNFVSRQRGATTRRYSARVHAVTRQDMPATLPGEGHGTAGHRL